MTPKKVARSRARPSASNAALPVVRLRVGDGAGGVVRAIPVTDSLTPLAAEWAYVLRNRSRWAVDEDLRLEIQERARATLASLEVTEPELRRIAEAPSQQVEIEFSGFATSESGDATLLDAASTFPWEFIISAATRALGRSHALLITRLIASARPIAARPVQTLLFVESAPGRIRDCYTFTTERERLNAAVMPETERRQPLVTADGVLSSPVLPDQWQVSETETLVALAERVGRIQPDVVHITGVDNHQVSRLVPEFYIDAAILERIGDIPPDGLIMRGEGLREVPVAADELVNAFARAGQPSPALVTLNLYYSAARTARQFVQHGAGAAIGFLDEVEDDLAEDFFQTFYLAWRRQGRSSDIPRAFGRTWESLRQKGHDLYGTGIVLWVGSSAFHARSEPTFGNLSSTRTEALSTGMPTATQLQQARALPMSQVLQVELDIPKDVNYSLLHNNRSFLETLTLTKLVDHALDGVSIEVQLSAGDGALPFRRTEVLLNEPQRAFASEVRIPLTAALLRSPRERVQSTAYVRVTWDNRIACEETKPVTLLPVDEWFDDTKNNPWLPSFVLPRDPAVARIVSAARRHLVTLQDDPAAGFDGYQSTDVANDDCDTVDEQVQALWTALVQEYRLAYINPPPAYSKRNQRLRTPSEIVGSTSGTCIDLALLLASCLEYVDIYPVIVLLTGHAFVGYWRGEEYHDAFRTLERVPAKTSIEVGTASRDSTVALVDPYGWRLAQQHYDEINGYLRRNELRFLEATGLCFNYSFGTALDEGRANLRVREDFDSLLDVVTARRASPAVTPLPMILTGREG